LAISVPNISFNFKALRFRMAGWTDVLPALMRIRSRRSVRMQAPAGSDPAAPVARHPLNERFEGPRRA
jgi:hypothetical protein